MNQKPTAFHEYSPVVVNGVKIQMFLDSTIADTLGSRFPWFRVEVTVNGKTGIRLLSSRKAMINKYNKVKEAAAKTGNIGFNDRTVRDTIRYNEALSAIATAARAEGKKAVKKAANSAASKVPLQTI